MSSIDRLLVDIVRHLLRFLLLLLALTLKGLVLWLAFNGRAPNYWLIVAVFTFGWAVIGYAKWSKWDKEDKELQ